MFKNYSNTCYRQFLLDERKEKLALFFVFFFYLSLLINLQHIFNTVILIKFKNEIKKENRTKPTT